MWGRKGGCCQCQRGMQDLLDMHGLVVDRAERTSDVSFAFSSVPLVESRIYIEPSALGEEHSAPQTLTASFSLAHGTLSTSL